MKRLRLIEKRSPRKGTKTSVKTLKTWELPHWKKVPEKGDENTSNNPNIEYTYFIEKRSPRKGTKTTFFPIPWTVHGIIEKRSPRKGTKTHRNTLFSFQRTLLKKGPRERGRKHGISARGGKLFCPIEKRSPRKGTKTISPAMDSRAWLTIEKRSPRKGTKT